MSNFKFFKIFGLIVIFSAFAAAGFSQEKKPKVRTVTIPISIKSDKPKKEQQSEEFVEAGEIIVKEDGNEQQILSIKSVSNTPLSLAILIQDDLTSNFNLQLDKIADFIRQLPKGSRVMIGYLRGGNLQTRQKFTEDLEKSAKSLRIVVGRGAVSGNPFSAVESALGKFDALPAGRRAILLISDGLDVTNGTDFASTTQSIELDRAILKSQRKSIAVYSFWNAATNTESGNSILISGGQGALSRISEETGGRAFFQGNISPISFEPFFKDLTNSLNRQFAITYLSTNMKKGFHKVQVLSTNEEVKIEHPKGYYYR
ncbi:MAG TPA: hypothetical protein PKE69_11130 [Pyrinomonadaceae bacterium]|nr:hypothetical protein [Pyrinomonadaceae bacterium]